MAYKKRGKEIEEDDCDWYDDEESYDVNMQKYYVVYTDYNFEKYNIHGVCTKESEGVKLFKEKLKDFLSYGPDDLTDLVLIEAYLLPEEVEILKSNDKSYESIKSVMCEIYHGECEELLRERGVKSSK